MTWATQDATSIAIPNRVFDSMIVARDFGYPIPLTLEDLFHHRNSQGSAKVTVSTLGEDAAQDLQTYLQVLANIFYERYTMERDEDYRQQSLACLEASRRTKLALNMYSRKSRAQATVTSRVKV